MSNLLISLILLYSIIFVVPAKAKTLENCPGKNCLMAEMTKNQNESTLNTLESYNTELNQILPDKTFEEIIKQINNRTSDPEVFYTKKCSKTERTIRKCGFQMGTAHSLIDFSTVILRRLAQQKFNETVTEIVNEWSVDLVDVLMEKLERINIDLKNYTSNFDEKSVKFIELYIRLHNTSNAINEELKSKFKTVNVDLESMQMKLANEMKIINDLIAKTKVVNTYFKDGIGNIDSVIKLAAAYEDYLQGHGIELPNDLDERIATYAKRNGLTHFNL